MTLEKIADFLPNGFHDAFLKRTQVDYVNREAELELEVWVGDLMSKEPTSREAYRAGKLRLAGLRRYTVEAPNREYLDEEHNGQKIDLAPPEYDRKSYSPQEPLPASGFAGAFIFTDEMNSFLNVVAEDC